MADLPSRLDFYGLGRDYVISRARRIDPAQVDVEGSDVNIFVGVASVLADQVSQQLGYRTNALLLDGADDEDLDRYAYDRYNLTRKGASPAVGTAVLSRASTAGGAGSVPIGSKLVTLTGIDYITTTTANFGASDLTSSANVRAGQAGKSSQVGVNAITRFSNPAALFDPTIVSTNTEPTAGGEDREDDDTFRSRIRGFWRAARRGILAAIEFGALTVPGVVSAQAIEALAPGPFPARVVNLYISDSSGVASQALANEVEVALDDFRAGGIAVLISTSLPLIVDITLQLTFRANVDTPSLTDQIRAAVVEFVNGLQVNGTLFVGQLFSIIQRFAADGVILNDQTIQAPVGDLVPAVGQTIRTTLASVVVL